MFVCSETDRKLEAKSFRPMAKAAPLPVLRTLHESPRHGIAMQISQLLDPLRVRLACGYPDANDSARLAGDPIYKLLLDRDPVTGRDLASQPTLSRFENVIGPKELYRMSEMLAVRVLQRHATRLRGRVRQVTIDLYPTDDPTHGARSSCRFSTVITTPGATCR